MMDERKLGLEEAEMYARFAGEIVVELYEEPRESKIAAAEALIEKARRILRKLIDTKLNRTKAEAEETAARR